MMCRLLILKVFLGVNILDGVNNTHRSHKISVTKIILLADPWPLDEISGPGPKI